MHKKFFKINNFFLYLFVFSIVFEYWNPFGLGGVFSIAKMATILYIITSLPFLNERLSLHKIKIFVVPITLYLLLEILSSLRFIIHVNSFSDILPVRIVKYLFLLVFIVNHLMRHPFLLTKILKVYIYSAITLSILFSFGIGIEETEKVSRLVLFGENPNGIGLKAALALLMILSLILEKYDITKVEKIIFIIGTFPLTALVVATASRGAILVLFAGAAIMLLLLKKNVLVKVPILALAAIIGSYLLAFVLSDELMYARIQLTLEDGNTGRNDLWEASFNIFMDHPIIGVGRAGFKPLMEEYYGSAMGAHNAFLEILASTGIIGFIIFMVFYLNLFKYAVKNYINQKKTLFLLLFLAMTLHLFKAGGVLTQTFTWFIFALIIGATRMNDSKI